jgi:hypothetical protein
VWCESIEWIDQKKRRRHERDGNGKCSEVRGAMRSRDIESAKAERRRERNG